VNRAGIVGSVGGTLVLGALLLRNSAPAPTPAYSPQPGTQSRASSTLPRSTKTAKRKPAGTAGDGQKDDRLSEDGPWNASQDHFAGAWPGQCPGEAVHAGKKSAAAQNGVSLLRQGDEHRQSTDHPRNDLWCIPDTEHVAAMIAIAPDPAHTHLALMFDRTIETVQLAAQSANYVADRYWLPWDVARKTEWADYDSLQKANEDQKQNEKQPGLILFRWDGEHEEGGNGRVGNAAVLYVFLVTDTATAGMNGEQFSNAVKYVREVCAPAGGCAGDGTIHIMGPTFSGSLDSLSRLTAAKGPQGFTAYSGTVSSTCAEENQHLLDQPSSLCPKNLNYKQAANLRFRSLVSSTESAVNQFIRMLEADGDIKCDGIPEVAILSEGSTTYGGATRDIRKRDTDNTLESDVGPCYTSFVYPREIASLRNAYQGAGNQPAPANAAAPASPYLQLQLTDQGNGGDEPRDFSIPQGPLSKEAVLMNDAAEMRRGRYRYVGISATNVLDALFLTKFLRTAVPDARLFIFDSDLIFERDLDNSSYLGTLAITTYPLMPRWDWTSAGQRLFKLPLADQYEQGQYNASVFAIREALGSQPRDPNDSATLYGCTEPCSEKELPLWLTAVGTGGYWPVQMLAGPQGTVQPKQDLLGLRATDFSTAWKASCALLCVLAGLHVLVLLTTSPVARHFREFNVAGRSPEQGLFLINLASASLALALAMMVMPFHFRQKAGIYVSLIAVATCVSIILLLAVCISLNALLVFRSKWEREQEKGEEKDKEKRSLLRPPLVSLFVWTIPVVLGVAWWTLFKSDPTSVYGLFFAYRAVHLATGVSPVTPMLLLLAVVYVWSIFEMWRLRFNEQSRPRLCTKPPFPGASIAGPSTEKKISDAVHAFLLKNSYLAGCVVTAVLWFLAFQPLHPFQLFERPAFGRVYEVLLCTAVLMMLTKGFRLGLIWSELRGLLFELDRSPIRLAFSRLKGFNWSPIWRQGGQEAEWVFIARSLEALRRLGSCDRDMVQAVKTCDEPADPGLEEVHEQLQNILKELEAGGDRPALRSQVKELQFAVRNLQNENNSPDACKQFRFRALERQLAAVDGILGMPDVAACADIEVDKIRQHLRAGPKASFTAKDDKILKNLRARYEAVSLVQTIRHYRGSRPSVSDAQEDKGLPDFEEGLAPLQQCLAQALNYTLDILNFHWNKPGVEATETEGPEKPEKPEKPDPQAIQIRRLEEFAALRYVSFIRAVLAHLRHSLIFLAVSFSLVLLSLNVYSFEPHQSLVWSFTGMFVVVGFIIVVMLMQVHRDQILSRITGTEPNQLGLDFYLRIISFGAIPLLTLLSAHFPAIGRSLVSFLQPGLEALK
jgi:hypothetical protein